VCRRSSLWRDLLRLEVGRRGRVGEVGRWVRRWWSVRRGEGIVGAGFEVGSVVIVVVALRLLSLDW
jgi:hypothetical protein